MKRILRRKRTIAIYTIGFLLPIGILFCAFAHLGIAPFGDKSILINDLSSQYVDFFAYYRNTLRSGDLSGFLYSFSKGPGGNFFGIFTYYLASPFNLLLLFFDNLEMGLFVLTLLKSGLSGTTLIYFLSQRRGTLRFSDPAFGLMYALCAYFVANSYQLLWLDGMIFLPLIIGGMECILKGKRSTLFIASLSVMAISSYYITYMIALFTALYFVWYCVVHFHFTEIKVILDRFLRVLRSALCSLCIAGVTLIPSFFALLQGKSEKLGVDFTLSRTFSLFSGILKFFPGRYDNVGQISAPYLYCGMLVSLLVLGFFFVKKLPLKTKFATFAFLALLFFSMYNNTLHTIWHLFAVPEAFPYRFGFVVCFLMVSVASYTFDHLSDLSSLFAVAGVLILGLLLVKRTLFIQFLGPKLFYCSILLAAGFLFLLTFRRFTHSRRLSLLAAAFLVLVAPIDMFFNTYLLLRGADAIMGYETYGSYAQTTAQTQRLLTFAESETSSFFRLENLAPRSLNDAFSVGYSGISHFSSLFEQDTLDAMQKLGYTESFYGMRYTECVPARDSLLGITYVVAPKEFSVPYEPLFCDGEVTLYRNNLSVPLCFIASSESFSLTSEPSAFATTFPCVPANQKETTGTPYALKPQSTESEEFIYKLKNSPVNFNIVAQNHLTGNFVLQQNELFYSSIPYDTAWKIKIDGEDVMPDRYLGNFIALSPAAGEHNFTMTYVPRGLLAGSVVTFLSLACTIFCSLRHRRHT